MTFRVGAGGHPTIWPLSGILLSVLLLHDASGWPSFLLLATAASFAAFGWILDAPWVGLGIGIVSSGQCALGAWLIRRFVGVSPAFESLREVLGFLGWGVIVSNLAVGPLGAFFLAIGSGESFAAKWIDWCLAHGVGMLVMTPLIQTWVPVLMSPKARLFRRWPEAAVLAISVVVVTSWVLVTPSDSPRATFRFPITIFPFLLWACLRFGVLGESAAMLLVSALAVWLVGEGGGRFAAFFVTNGGGGPGVQLYICILAVSCLSIAAVDWERRRAVTSLAQEEGRFRLLVEGVKDHSFCMLDCDGRVRTWNIGAQRQKGYCAGEIIGHHFERFFTPEDRQGGKPAGLLQRAAGSLEWVQDAGWRVRRDGSSFWAQSVITALRDEEGKLTGFSEVTRDLSDRRRAELDLRMSDERFRLLSRATYEAVYDRNVQTGQAWWNEGIKHIFGYAASDVHPDVEWWTERIHPEDKRRVLESLEKSIDSSGPRWESEYRFRRADGAYAYVLDRGYLMRGEEGKQLRMIGAMLDLTQRRKAEEEVHRLKEELETRVEERTLELGRKNRDLEAFTYSVSHDLKAPLRGIDGYARILLEEYALRLGEHGRGYLGNICQAARQMAQLIENLLHYARLDRKVLRAVSQDVVSLVSTVVAEREEELRQRRIETIQDVIPAEVQVDPEGLLQALRNILDNAIKFTRDTPEPRIEIRGRAQEGIYLLSVRDNGIGFDMRFHDRIFEIFQRLERSEEYPGTGVGLTIVKRAMDRLGGRVWGESSPGQGAVFYLELVDMAEPVEIRSTLRRGEP